jgi:hypothetical protein
MKLRWSGLVVFVISVVPLSARAESWRCGPRLVNVGDLTLDVRIACGEPSAIERRSEARTLRDARGLERARISQIEEWSYMKDGRELMRTLVFEDGRLIAIRVGGKPPTDTSRCEKQMFTKGAAKAEVELTCGAPVQRDVWIEHVEERAGDLIVGRSIQRERWVYNFGPSRFLRIFEFANGRLVAQRTGGYGYALP